MVEECAEVETTVDVISQSIKHVNEMLSEGHYFFSDIKQQGILLFDTGKKKLGRRKYLKPTERQRIAQNHYDIWLPSANSFFKTFKFNLSEGDNNIAAFILHQATERYLAATLLVHTDYKPNTHNLAKLYSKVLNLDRRFWEFFKVNNKEEEQRFQLLRKAYVEARYNPDFIITKAELEYLGSRVEILASLTESICKEKIKQIIA
jgi:HEPN domain-containing protein